MRAAMAGKGRRPGRALTDVEFVHLQLLVDLRARARSSRARWEEQLEDFVYECRRKGASARGMAKALGVGPSTIQGWTKAAERRRAGG